MQLSANCYCSKFNIFGTDKRLYSTEIISQEIVCSKLCNDVDNHKFPTEISIVLCNIIFSIPHLIECRAVHNVGKYEFIFSSFICHNNTLLL